MMSLDFIVGDVVFDNLSSPLCKGELDFNELKEDLLQVCYVKDVLLDVGWYPSFDPDGKFTITVVKDFDWEAPVLNYKAETYEDLVFKLRQAQKYILDKLV